MAYYLINHNVHLLLICYCSLHGLGSLTWSYSELTSETMNPLRKFDRTFSRGIGPSQGLYHREQQNTEIRRHTSMLRAGFEPTIPVFRRSKTISNLDSAITETAYCWYNFITWNTYFYLDGTVALDMNFLLANNKYVLRPGKDMNDISDTLGFNKDQHYYKVIFTADS
jgi:hypothetical protein